MRTTNAYALLFAVTAALALITGLLGVGLNVLLYNSSLFWWNVRMTEWGGNVLYYFFFLAAPLVAAVTLVRVVARLEWLLPIIGGAIVLPFLLKGADDLLGGPMAGGLAGTGFGWFLLPFFYGLMTALGALAVLILLAGRKQARRTRL